MLNTCASCCKRKDANHFILSRHLSLRKCTPSVKPGCTDQVHILRDGQTRNDRLSSVEDDLPWSTCSSSEARPFVLLFACYAVELILRFYCQGNSKLRPPKSGTAGLILLLSQWHDSGTDERREDRDRSPWHPQGRLHSSPALFYDLPEVVFVHSLCMFILSAVPFPLSHRHSFHLWVASCNSYIQFHFLTTTV